MIDINSILTSAVQQAVDQAADQILLPYRERIATLEDSNETLKITIQNLQLSLSKVAGEVYILTNKTTPASASNLTEDRVRVIATEVVDDHLYRHTTDFDHDPLADLKGVVQRRVDEVFEDLDPSLLKEAVNELLSDATVSITL